MYSAALLVAVALGVATAQTSTPDMSSSASTSGNDDIAAPTPGSVSCVFRYVMPTASNAPSGVVTRTEVSSGSDSDDKGNVKGNFNDNGNFNGNDQDDDGRKDDNGSIASSGSVADGSDATSPDTVGETPERPPVSSSSSPSVRPPLEMESGSTEDTPEGGVHVPSNTSESPSSTSPPAPPTTPQLPPSSSTEPPATVAPKPPSALSSGNGSAPSTALSPPSSPPTKPATTTTDDRRLMSAGSGTAAESPPSTTPLATEETPPSDVGDLPEESSPTGATPSSSTMSPPSSLATTRAPLAPRTPSTAAPPRPSEPPQVTKLPAGSPPAAKLPPSVSDSDSGAGSAGLPTPVLNASLPSSTSGSALDTINSTTNASDPSGPTITTTTTAALEFSCDTTFYSAWTKMGLTCQGTELDVTKAAAGAECLIYSGTSSGSEISDLATCMSVCRFPACTSSTGEWDYAADDGINSPIYANLDFIRLMQLAGTQAADAVASAVQQPFANFTFAATTECDYVDESSFSTCQCASATAFMPPSSEAGGPSMNSNAQYAIPVNKGLEDANHWADGTKKSTVDKAGITSTTIGSSAATVSVVAGGVMSVASGIVGGTSAGVASGVSAAASVGITMAAIDICQFSVMLSQMNVDARPRFMENMGKQMAPAAFTFMPFGKSKKLVSADDTGPGSKDSTATRRRLITGTGSTSDSGSLGSGSSSTDTGVQGMERYAFLIGVDPDMLFYVAVAGIACMVGIVFGLYAVAMGLCYFIVEDFVVFSRKWLDKAIGVLMMILILSEYVIGATAMYQICYCIDRDTIDMSFFLAILTLLGLAFGTILYGVVVIKNNEDELRDLGTKDHFDKKFHNRYGPLYDEHSFEGRFFFAPKLLLALLCGMTTGMVWIQGLWQIVVLIALHIAFLLYLEIKQPYPTAFVQKTSSFVIIIKISALFLSFFLLSSATSFTQSIPDDLREGVAFAIVGLQVLVLVCLMIRQVYIFYRTWKLKRDGADNKTVRVQTTNAREGSEAFFALGGSEPPQYYGNNTYQNRGNSLAVLGNDSTPKMQDPRRYAQETPSNLNRNHGNLPQEIPHPQECSNTHSMQRSHTVVRHENHYRNNEVDL